MTEEGKITMTEFKTVVESFRSDLKKIVEVMNHGFEKAGKERHAIKKDVQGLKQDVGILKTDSHSVKEQIGLLLEGQTEIRAGMNERATVQDLKKLDKRVTRLEKKIA